MTAATAKVGRIEADLVVVGGGVAGLSVALAAAPRKVVLVTKAELGGGCATALAQGGIAAPVGEGDSPALHGRDSLAVGGGLANPERVGELVAGARAAIDRLVGLGARFDRDAAGNLALGREAAHSKARIVHADGDRTGREVARTLAAAVATSAHITVVERAFVDQLLAVDGRIVGVGARRADGTTLEVCAYAVVLASGGIGQVWRWTTNPVEATGDGFALAARAGALLRDPEMVQFHPTALAVGGDPLPLLTEALRGEGAILLDDQGLRFMVDEHPEAELAPRDVVASAIARRLARGGKVWLDARAAVGERFPERFPTVFAACQAAGIDPRYEPMPVVPACHYHMGGIAVDGDGHTSLPGLFAVGEVAGSGLHGANRLASNSLLEGLVVAERVAQATALEPHRGPGVVEVVAQLGDRDRPWNAEHPLRARLRLAVQADLGVVRDEAGLSRLLDWLASVGATAEAAGGELVALWTVASAVAWAARERRESRGAHQRRDWPGSHAGARSTEFTLAATATDVAALRRQPRRAGLSR